VKPGTRVQWDFWDSAHQNGTGTVVASRDGINYVQYDSGGFNFLPDVVLAHAN
jgi:hypothetical protein